MRPVTCLPRYASIVMEGTGQIQYHLTLYFELGSIARRFKDALDSVNNGSGEGGGHIVSMSSTFASNGTMVRSNVPKHYYGVSFRKWPRWLRPSKSSPPTASSKTRYYFACDSKHSWNLTYRETNHVGRQVTARGCGRMLEKRGERKWNAREDLYLIHTLPLFSVTLFKMGFGATPCTILTSIP